MSLPLNKQKRGKNPKLFSIWSHCKTHAFWHPFSSAIATLTRCFLPKIHTKWYKTRWSSCCPSVIQAKLMTGCSTPMALHQYSDTCSSLPCKPISRGKVAGKARHLSSLPALQCSMWCRNSRSELGSFSFHQSTKCLSRKSIPSSPYHICRQRHREWFARTSQQDRSRTKFITLTTRSCVFREASCTHTIHPLRGVSQTLCKAERSGHLQLRPFGASVGRKNAATKDWGLLELCSREKERSPLRYRNLF